MCHSLRTCGVITDLRKFRDQDKVLKFLKGLNEQFSHVRSQIMMIEPLLNLEKSFSIVIGQEKQLTVPLTHPSDFEYQTLSSQVQPQQAYNGQSSKRYRGRYCTYNGRGQACVCVLIVDATTLL